jgi:hypothetical protein
MTMVYIVTIVITQKNKMIEISRICEIVLALYIWDFIKFLRSR